MGPRGYQPGSRYRGDAFTPWPQILLPQPGPAHSPTQARSGEAGRVQSCLPGVTLVLSPQGKRYKNSLETVGTPDSGRGRSEKKAIK